MFYSFPKLVFWQQCIASCVRFMCYGGVRKLTSKHDHLEKIRDYWATKWPQRNDVGLLCDACSARSEASVITLRNRQSNRGAEPTDSFIKHNNDNNKYSDYVCVRKTHWNLIIVAHFGCPVGRFASMPTGSEWLRPIHLCPSVWMTSCSCSSCGSIRLPLMTSVSIESSAYFDCTSTISLDHLCFVMDGRTSLFPPN